MDSPGFKRFKARRAAAATENGDYRDFVSSMTGEQAERMAGVASHGVAGGEDPAEGTPDAAVYAAYLAELDGSAARRRSEQNAKREKTEREQEVIRHVSQVGGGMSRSFEHLRDRIPGAGRPHEGS